MKFAVTGPGISGMMAAWLLNPQHELTVFEANDYIGGHTNTIDDYADALAQAQTERPELWTAERKARADVAAGLVARGVQP